MGGWAGVFRGIGQAGADLYGAVQRGREDTERQRESALRQRAAALQIHDAERQQAALDEARTEFAADMQKVLTDPKTDAQTKQVAAFAMRYSRLDPEKAEAIYGQWLTLRQPEEELKRQQLQAQEEWRQAQLTEQKTRDQDKAQYQADMLGMRQHELEFRIDDAKERARDRRLSEEDRRQAEQDRVRYWNESLALRRDEMQSRLMLRQFGLEGKTKVPTTIQTRINQAVIAGDQIDQVRELLKDPALTRYLGPVVGQAGAITRRTVPIVQGFYQALQSLINMNPILHGYRGGAQAHVIFEAATGDLSYTPKALEAGLDQLQDFLDRMTKDTKKLYPNDPFFQALDTTGAPPPSGGTKPPRRTIDLTQ